MRKRRPFWFVVLVTATGATAVAVILGFTRYHFGWMFPLFALLNGAAGGIFAWVLCEEHGRQKSWLAAILGLLISALIYAGHRYVDYRIALSALDGDFPFALYLMQTAGAGTHISRYIDSSGIHVGETITWGLWMLDCLTALGTGAAMGKFVDIDVDSLQKQK